jgi:hypothetical protein
MILLGGFIVMSSNKIQQASAQDQTQTNIANNAKTNSTNIVLVHGAWVDGSSWSKK